MARGAADEDSGVRVGTNGRFQPGVELGLLYDTNVYRSETRTDPDLVLRVEPHLRLLERSDNVNFDLYGEYRLKQYLGAFVDHSADTVGHKDLNVYGNYLLGIGVFTRPNSSFSFIASDDLSRLSREFDNADATFYRYSLMDHLTNQAEIGVEGRPGSALRIKGMFHFDLGRYTGASDQGASASANRRVFGQAYDLYGTVEIGYRFFPKTQVLAMVDFGHILWDPDLQEGAISTAGSDDALSNLNQYDADHWRFWVGIQGKFSRRIAVQALFGYGNAYYPDNPEAEEGDLRGPDGILGKLQLHWTPVTTQRVTLGFVRDYRFVYFSNYHVTTSPYLRYNGQIAGFLLPHAGFRYLYRVISGGYDRTDHEIRADVGVGFQIKEFFSVGVEYDYWAIVSSTEAEATFSDHMIGLQIELGF